MEGERREGEAHTGIESLSMQKKSGDVSNEMVEQVHVYCFHLVLEKITATHSNPQQRIL